MRNGNEQWTASEEEMLRVALRNNEYICTCIVPSRMRRRL